MLDTSLDPGEFQFLHTTHQVNLGKKFMWSMRIVSTPNPLRSLHRRHWWKAATNMRRVAHHSPLSSVAFWTIAPRKRADSLLLANASLWKMFVGGHFARWSGPISAASMSITLLSSRPQARFSQAASSSSDSIVSASTGLLPKSQVSPAHAKWVNGESPARTPRP